MTWFSVRHVLHLGSHDLFEERITLWEARNIDAAIDLAINEAAEHCNDLGMTDTGLYQAFEIRGPVRAAKGREVFSLMRTSKLPMDDYLERFFLSGDERERPS